MGVAGVVGGITGDGEGVDEGSFGDKETGGLGRGSVWGRVVEG